jgi:hypothetical protein
MGADYVLKTNLDLLSKLESPPWNSLQHKSVLLVVKWHTHPTLTAESAGAIRVKTRSAPSVSTDEGIRVRSLFRRHWSWSVKSTR